MVKGRIMNHKTSQGLLTGLAAMLVTASASADIRFQDVSSQAGVTGFTESWGSSWGDLNGDNWPDLYVQGHNSFQRIYRNTGDASIFENIAYELDPGGLWFAQQEDKHGASWADFDNDGDMDVLQGVSATGPAQLLVNTNGKFTERAVDADLSGDGASRQPVWFDYTGDGFLDVAQLAFSSYALRPPGFRPVPRLRRRRDGRRVQLPVPAQLRADDRLEQRRQAGIHLREGRQLSVQGL
jgi:hypothetical protein